MGIEGYVSVTGPFQCGYKRAATVMFALFSEPCGRTGNAGINGVLRGIDVSETGFVSFPSHRFLLRPFFSDAAIAINTVSRFYSAFPHSPPSVFGTRLLRRHSFLIIIIIRNNKREEKNYGS